MPHPSTVIPLPVSGPSPSTALEPGQKQYEANAMSPHAADLSPGQAFSASAAHAPFGGNASPQQPVAYYVQVPPPGRPRKDGWCATPDWALFFMGWFTCGVGWIVGAFLPLCRTPRFENGMIMGAWIANCACACVVTTYFSLIAVFFTGIALYGI
ncbi:hypothetical protein KFL_002270140 [Klebsormidium nitens]|uniref:60S ribosomal protein L18a-like protein n=1 Tax=Klebsormidium nitens TaxID=105231 RepID=A0A1Y1I2X5_KLENI|nr:hypothetical protein KFL_002270140 [Klebsormidium nitens]|eukprot:GAQ85280.1 hypothetical protein KFL_002270140 [Klebsormidium nitens]